MKESKQNNLTKSDLLEDIGYAICVIFFVGSFLLFFTLAILKCVDKDLDLSWMKQPLYEKCYFNEEDGVDEN